MTDVDRLWDAKVRVMAGLASGPVMLITDEDERAGRFFEMMSLLETEHDDHFKTATPAVPAPRRVPPSSTSVRVDWGALIESCAQHRGHAESVHYRSHLTASATVTKLRERYRQQFPSLEVWSAKDDGGDGGSVFVSVG